jgi:hypothetical protein
VANRRIEGADVSKTVAEKLFIKPGYRIAVINAPEGQVVEMLGVLPDKVTLSETLDGSFDLIVYYAATRDKLLPMLDTLKRALKAESPLWIAYPKGGAKAKIKTDLNRDILWQVVADYHLTPVHQIAIDDTWSALRFKVGG